MSEPPPLSLHKRGGTKFFKNGSNGEMGNFYLKWGESQAWEGGGVGFILGGGGGMGNF